MAEFREAVRLEPSYSGAHSNLGVALDDLDDTDGAIAAFREAVRHAPDYMLGHANLPEYVGNIETEAPYRPE